MAISLLAGYNSVMAQTVIEWFQAKQVVTDSVRIYETPYSKTIYECEAMKIVKYPNVNPIPVVRTDSSVYFWSWGTIAFKPIETGSVTVRIRAREDHSEINFANIEVRSKNVLNFSIVDSTFYQCRHSTLLEIEDSVYISFTNDNWDRNVEVDWIELEYSNMPPDTGKATLEWNANVEPDLAGYKIYYGYASRSYSKILDVGNVTRFTVYWLPYFREIFFAATAYDTVPNESGYSNEVSIILIPDSTTFEYKKGDWNKDRKISLTDMIQFTARFGATIDNVEYDLVFDFNEDQKISLFDMIKFTEIFGLIY